MSAQKARPFRETFRIRSYETDELDRVSVRALCQYLQEAASHHARRLGVEAMEHEGRSLSWVLARLRLRLDAMPSWGSELTITTWPSDVDRLYAYRDFKLEQEDGPIGAAVTHWLLIDLETRKPVRIPEQVSGIELPERERALPEPDRRPQAPDAPTLVETFSAHRFLIDVNQHVNSAVYLDWALETIPEGVWTSHRLSELDVLFRAEARKGDRIEARSEELVEVEEGSVFEHRVIKEDGETELIRGRSRWVSAGVESDTGSEIDPT